MPSTVHIQPARHTRTDEPGSLKVAIHHRCTVGSSPPSECSLPKKRWYPPNRMQPVRRQIRVQLPCLSARRDPSSTRLTSCAGWIPVASPTLVAEGKDARRECPDPVTLGVSAFADDHVDLRSVLQFCTRFGGFCEITCAFPPSLVASRRRG